MRNPFSPVFLGGEMVEPWRQDVHVAVALTECLGLLWTLKRRRLESRRGSHRNRQRAGGSRTAPAPWTGILART